MHDPLTVAWEIKYPWKTGTTFRYHPSFITVWHKDPETDGTDSSCWHRYVNRKLNRYEKALNQYLYDAETIFDNRPHFPDSKEHHWFQKLKELRREWRQRRDPWRIHWKLHFWHYRIQIHPLQQIWHWLFHRCCICHERFGWDEGAISNWDGNRMWHMKCDSQLRPK